MVRNVKKKKIVVTETKQLMNAAAQTRSTSGGPSAKAQKKKSWSSFRLRRPRRKPRIERHAPIMAMALTLVASQ